MDRVNEHLTVAVEDQLGFNECVGMHFAEIWNIGKKMLYHNLINVVTAHSQSANSEHSVIPVNYKESDLDVADSSEEEDDEAIS